MRLFVTIFCIILCFNANSQLLDRFKYQSTIADTSYFLNKKIRLIGSTKERKIDLENIKQPELTDIYVFKHDEVLISNTNSNLFKVTFVVLDTLDPSEWIINIKTNEPCERFSFVPIYCDGKYLVVNVLSSFCKKRSKKNKMRYSSTYVFKIEGFVK